MTTTGHRRQAPRLTLPRPGRSPWALAAAVLLHVGLLGLLSWARQRDLLTWVPAHTPGAVADVGGGGGGGGRRIREVALPALRNTRPPPAPDPVELAVVPRLVEPVPPVPESVEPVVLPPPPADTTRPTTADEGGAGAGAGSGGGTGGGRGTGTGTGTGPGSGPGSGGEGGRALPPEPRQLILPPLDYPRQMRGRTIAVTFWVNTSGRVERVVLEPEIEDRGFARRFEDVMRNYRFRPARSGEGAAIPGTTTVTVTF
jgi:periplasmic protein TonB